MKRSGARFWPILVVLAGLGPGVLTLPAAAQEFELAVRGTDQGIYRNRFSGVFQGFQFLSGHTAATPALVVRNGGAFDVVVRGTDSGIYHGRFDGTSFSGFAAVGGFTPGAPTIVPGSYRAVATSGAILPGTTRIDGTGCDQCLVPIQLPFPVRFYGETHQALVVSSNGNVQFESALATASSTNGLLPTQTLGRAILAQWDNLTTTGAGQGIFTATFGVAPARLFVIEWRAQYTPGGGSTNFEIVFTENSPVITVVYGASSGSGVNGATATAGVHLRFVGPYFTQFSFNQPVLTSGLRIDYIPTELDLAVRGTDNAIYHNRFNGIAWTGYTRLGGASPSRPALAAGPNGRLELVVRGTDNGIYHNRFDGVSWSSFAAVGGRTVDAPALASRSTGVDLAVRGIDNGVYHNRFTAGPGTWSGFVAVGGATLSPPALVGSMQSIPPGRLDLVVRGTDSGIYHNHFDATSWTGYVAIPGATIARPALAANPGTGSLTPGRLDLVVRGSDDGIYHSQFNGAWSPFVALPGRMLSEPALASP
jgi:hypothetical protein